jgi:hypothetical protein
VSSPNPPFVAVSAGASIIDQIHDQIFALAKSTPGVAWAGSTQWDFPLPTQVTGVPWLAVLWPQFHHYEVDYVPTGDEMPQAYEAQFVWDVDVVALAPFTAGTDATYRGPIKTMNAVHAQFRLNPNLNGYCDETKLGKPEPYKLSKEQGELWFAAGLTIRVIETVTTQYR